MPNVKISALPEDTNLTDTDVVPVVSDAATKKSTLATLKDFFVAAGSITTAKLADLAVTAAKLANGAVTEYKLDNAAVTTNKIASSAVNSSKIENGAVTLDKIADGAVTNDKLASNSVDGFKLQNGAVESAKLGIGAVTEEKSSFRSGDDLLWIDHVTASEQDYGTIADAATGYVETPLLANGELVRILWSIVLEFNSVDYVCDYLTVVKRIGGTLTTLHEVAIVPPPSGVTISASVTPGNHPRIAIANATGHTITHYVHYSLTRQIK